jgi:hypothetical protein
MRLGKIHRNSCGYDRDPGDLLHAWSLLRRPKHTHRARMDFLSGGAAAGTGYRLAGVDGAGPDNSPGGAEPAPACRAGDVGDHGRPWRFADRRGMALDRGRHYAEQTLGAVIREAERKLERIRQ